MERLQAYKFQLRPKAGQESLMRRFAGCCRFLWNKALALEKETYEKEGKRLGFSLLCEALRDWKKENDTSLSSASSGDPQNERKLTPSVLSRGPGTGQRGSSWYSRV